MLVDTHCHLDFERFDGDRDEVVERARAAGLTAIIVPALDLENAEMVLGLADRYACVYAAVGIHPNSATGWRDDWLDELRRLATHEKVVAIGEIGLDYYWDKTPQEVQQRAFGQQLALAAELELPTIIHNREADVDIVQMVGKATLRPKPGVFHSFSAGWDAAASVLELGYYLGFTGPITYRNADTMRDVAARAPVERLLVETDSPFLAPQAHRGKRNEPAYVTHVAAELARVREAEMAAMAAQTTENAAYLFGQRILSDRQ